MTQFFVWNFGEFKQFFAPIFVKTAELQGFRQRPVGAQDLSNGRSDIGRCPMARTRKVRKGQLFYL